MFTIYSDPGSDSTIVSNLFIDEYMKSANDAQIKVYLYLLRMMGTRRPTSISDMADQFNHTEKDVVRSLRYWERKGLLDLTFGSNDDLVSIRLCRPDGPKNTAAGTVLLDAFSGHPVRQEKASFPAGQDAGRIQEPRVLPMASGASTPAPQTLPGQASCSFAGNKPFREALSKLSAFTGNAPAAEGFSKAPSFAGNSSPAEGFSKASSLTGNSSPAEGFSKAPSFAGNSFPAEGFSKASSLTGNSSPAEGFSKASAQGSSEASPEASSSPKICSDLEALERFRSDAGRAQLLFVIEQYIGKPLSLNEIRIISHISENLHFSDDLIDYLLQYCVDRGKKDFRFIRKVAQNWAQQGIMTPAQAEASAAKNDAASHTGEEYSGGLPRRKNSAGQKQSNPSPEEGFSGKKTAKTSKRVRSANSFNQFEQNSYDFDALEKELLGVSE